VRKHSFGNSVRVEFLVEQQEFSSLEQEWEDLYNHCPRATPFQSWEWLYSWWEYYGEGYRLQLITVRNAEGLLVGILPFTTESRQGFSRLLFVGSGQSDYLDIIVRAGWEDTVLEAGVQALEQIGTWHVADLQLLRPDALVWGIFQRWVGLRTCVWQDNCPVIEVKPWDELLLDLKKNRRSAVRQTLRRATTDGLHRKEAHAKDTKQAALRLVALHREAWQDRDIGLEHLTQRFEDFTIAAADRMASRGLGSISEFWEDGEVLVSSFLIFGRDACGIHIMGASQKALQRYQWSSLCIWDAIDVAHSKNKTYLDLLRGDEPYKLRWSSRIIPTYRLILGRHWTIGAPYAGYHVLRSRAKLWTRSDSAPQWIKNAPDKYRTLRHGRNRFMSKVRERLRISPSQQ
jgi:CelD/BcsL family acetyltransferase involved in cellulose biosynthesis